MAGQTHTTLFFLTVFLGTGVEVVEMMTILIGVGATAGWYPALLGAGCGFAILVGLVAALGSALTFVPLSALRAVIGILLLLFGLQWLRTGTFRVAVYGLKKRPSDRENRAARETAGATNMDWAAFVIALKGVLLEGLEIVFIVVAFGAATKRLGLGISAALASFACILILSLFVSRQLKKIPEHIIKYAVGLLLVAYGTFWAAEGVGVIWPDEDLSILFLLAFYLLFSLSASIFIKRMIHGPPGHESP